MIHFVWSTKNRAPFLNDEIRPEVFEHIKQNAIKKGIFIDTVDGYFEHIHCLISLSPDQTISKIIQLIKGESSFWINQQNLCNGKFEWQDEYFGASVSPSDIQKVRDYINNQEEHHRKKTFQQEYDDFLKLLGLSS